MKFSDMLKATKHLLTYASYISVTIGVCAEEFLITGIGVFLAKLIQIQFQYTAGFASILFGIVAGAAALTGNLLGEKLWYFVYLKRLAFATNNIVLERNLIKW